MKKSLFLLTSYLFLLASAMAQKTITVENTTSLQRSELVAISAEQLGIEAGKGVIVRDAFGIERATQWTYDGQLLLPVHVRPDSKATFTIVEGTPAAVLSSVGGAMYPSRLEDIAFENDRIGFRLYGPALQRKGEKGFGHDLWVKRTTELILPELYSNDPRLSFHLDYGKGLDCYGVGPTLGCGTPCLIREGKIVYPWCYETYKILDKGPLRFTVQVDFPATNPATTPATNPPTTSATTPDGLPSGITEHRILSLDKGSNFCEATVWYTATTPDGATVPDEATTPDGLPSGIAVAAGLAIRPADPKPVVIGKDYVHYADPTVDPERHQCQIYTALLFPDASTTPDGATSGITIKQQESHVLGILKNYHGGQRFHYFFGAAWSEFDVRSQAEWQLRIEGFMQAQRHPLLVTVQ